ncbi:P-loop containing nucleoside triphosphate hydrolase protein [Metschnikowia bicuspidata var. bicuspidata NRRL YB-4993]|uniref:ATP-dependent RNA helicase SUV3, mitochondrial n=1 Tax=Metschnikowia bicuspidata var. bicuspidata NRRL YB-4993 TaxID=869754 RepID=A0A1A0HK61_9ASCO|nr:P-loop containing nucleoside triphosphate hydrolase protein [Metschnikowia bicuspidata var. bicuspidata NRRL YB-4993]OBA24569.1 P-loop containing nucleoside triphosphate hydrolase protein [Metschnikowia bicuspidata var. bicuspidata NRRL YB-4993]
MISINRLRLDYWGHSKYVSNVYKTRIPAANLLPNWRSLSASTDIEDKPTLLQLKLFTQQSLDMLDFRLKKREFCFPYEDLYSMSHGRAAKLMKSFEEKIWASFEKHYRDNKMDTNDTTDQTVSITQYFKPRPECIPSIVQLIYMGLYPRDLKTYFGQESEKAALCDILTELYHQHYLQADLSSDFNSKQVDMNWDISRPSDWYPGARKMKRKVIMHVGPTNSGKTYNSLQAFAKAKSGYYAGPLRLLAREIYEKFQSQNISCNLITGEEVVPSLDTFGNVAQLSSGTIEMIPLHKKMDICIIDEIQMIADSKRGSAWTNAVLGVQAKELHLCGEESAVKLIQKLLETTGEEIEIKRYERKGKLTMLSQPVGKLSALKKGDCLVAFSKRKILELKCEIENSTPLKVGVIYGALPPEIRSQESSKFNDGEYDVLVASDAIGMGLNLKIKRIVFWTSVKFDGSGLVDLSVSNVKQIGGRAGRFSLKDGELEGFVTTFHKKDLSHVSKCMRMPTTDLDKACIWPSSEFWSEYLSSFRTPMNYKVGVDHFYKSLKDTNLKDYFLSDFDHQTQVIDLICSSGLDSRLTIEDQLRLAQVPVNLKHAETEVIQQTLRFLECIATGTSKSVLDLNFLYTSILSAEPTVKNSSENILQILTELEKNHKIVLVFMWLSQRWPTIFVDKESAGEIKTLIEKRIDEELGCLRIVARAAGTKAQHKNKQARI